MNRKSSKLKAESKRDNVTMGLKKLNVLWIFLSYNFLILLHVNFIFCEFCLSKRRVDPAIGALWNAEPIPLGCLLIRVICVICGLNLFCTYLNGAALSTLNFQLFHHISVIMIAPDLHTATQVLHPKQF